LYLGSKALSVAIVDGGVRVWVGRKLFGMVNRKRTHDVMRVAVAGLLNACREAA
jgi:hypothetical protein